ncbi:helix-turn-helix domain-containing protein [Frankia sp. Mgl5]|uniref:PucR family transcriptional regulator n=1 Tax=Frankia sp. Mgl5 TaxID=2933793 RepID=UPI00200F817D|nr:PucR family transcriptional regulator [Frankia sp. Mgl5]MCK9932881.1 helix-turn-helix domain-containing protein [Frankia sp. Mgl5]
MTPPSPAVHDVPAIGGLGMTDVARQTIARQAGAGGAQPAAEPPWPACSGVDLTRPHAAVVLHYDGARRDAWGAALAALDVPVRRDGAFGELGWAVLAGDAADVGRELAAVRSRLAAVVGSDRPVLAAAGRVVVGDGRDTSETASSLAEARAVLALLRHRGDGVQLLHSDTGLAGLLLAVPRARLESFARAELGPLLDRPELLATLAAWLETNGSRAAVAARIHMHRNSVGYRMDRVRELLGLHGDPPERMWRLHAAVVARELVAALPAGDAFPTGDLPDGRAGLAGAVGVAGYPRASAASTSTCASASTEAR